MRRFRLAKATALAALLLALLAPLAFAAEPYTYTVSFDTNGGSYVAPYENIHYNSLIPQPPDPARQGSTFQGWCMEPGLQNLWNFSQNHVTKDLTLYAKWSNLHRIFMENGSADVMYARQGERIYISANSPDWFYTFYRWVSTPAVAFSNRYNRRTYFIMPDRSVTIRATYRYTGGGNGLVVGGGCDAGSVQNLAAIAITALILAITKKRR